MRYASGMQPRVYLAGPDVFFPEPLVWAARKRAICLANGLDGVSPLDPLQEEPAAWRALGEAARIARCNEAHIRAADAVIANLTPFRGASADAGTVYEVGFARGLGRPVFAYSTEDRGFAERTAAAFGGTGGVDRDGLQIESFGLAENLMIACGVQGLVVQAAAGWTDLAAFTLCVEQAAAALGSRGTPKSLYPPAGRAAGTGG